MGVSRRPGSAINAGCKSGGCARAATGDDNEAANKSSAGDLGGRQAIQSHQLHVITARVR